VNNLLQKHLRTRSFNFWLITILTGLSLFKIDVVEARPPACGTGTVWRVNDTSGAWNGIWVQQPGGGTTYSGRWLKPGEPIVTGVLVISVQGDRVTFQRTDDPNVFQVTNCFYDGTFGADGTTASGTVTCNSGVGPLGPYNWSAQISCNDPRSGFEVNVDRRGSDYRNFPLDIADPAQCWAQCELESQCVAWTYVNPGVQGTQARCWLKNSVPPQVPNATFATSGVKGSSIPPTTSTPTPGSTSTPVPSPTSTPTVTPSPTPAASPTSPSTSTPTSAVNIDWSTSPYNRRGQNGQRFSYVCPPISTVPTFGGWGTDIYTDDSPVCPAAVHAGRITGAGGTVTIEVRPGQSSYRGSTRNGVTTNDYGQWGGSFIFTN
jgi:hypothetical protein